MSSHTAYIGIGSNTGDRAAHCRRALETLSAHPAIEIEKISRWYESDPFGLPDSADQSPYLNAAVRVKTSLDAEELLAALLATEDELGRPNPRPKNEPRTIDLDLLFFDEIAVSLGHLVLPHPELAKRLFVLIPLCDIAPDLVHPSLGLTLRSLAARCREAGDTARVEEWHDRLLPGPEDLK